jgi:isochorismate synthase
MQAYAIYRLPHEDHATIIRQKAGDPVELQSLSDLNGRCGFVVAPFEVKGDQPVVLIEGEREIVPLCAPAHPAAPACHLDQAKRVERTLGQAKRQSRALDDARDDKRGNNPSTYYKVDFANYHSQLENGHFRKIVLARCADENMPVGVEKMDLFYRACEMYPRLFIALVETPQSGCWLTATPEILLDGKAQDWRTIALAGTMKLEGDQLNGEGETLTWSTKNIQEQRIVATYITECLEQFTGDFREEGPRTVRAANLVHLRSDFTFKLADNDHIGDVLQALHPTPAVCGLPKREAFNFIVKNEHTPRRYYSGFMGPLQMDETHLYVSLRCMNIEGDKCHLYAGGGLLKDSTEEQEWQETEAKMETMKRLIYV